MKIADLDYAQLPSFKEAATGLLRPMNEPAVACPSDDMSSLEPLSDSSSPTTIPLLEEVLREFPDIPVQIDIKSTSPGLVEATLELIDAVPGCKDRVLIGSFVHSINERIYQLAASRIPIFASTKRMSFMLACFYLGILSRTHIYESGKALTYHLDTKGAVVYCMEQHCLCLCKNISVNC